MVEPAAAQDRSRLTLLIMLQGQWGERIADNVGRHCPATWVIRRCPVPRALPPRVDDPEEFLPPTLPAADLVLALGDTPGAATLLPQIVKMCGARSVIAPIDRNESLPTGLANQLRRWLADLGVTVVFPKPFCSLTETTYNWPPIVTPYQDALIQEFARHFGQPQLRVTVGDDQRIDQAGVERDSACGCARFVAQGLIGQPVGQAEYEAGMLHHHYPCLASMSQDSDYKDTLMHVSGHILREAVVEQVRDHLEPVAYFQPAGRVER
jgi:thymidylate synthase